MSIGGESPFDRVDAQSQFGIVSKKPIKVEEPASTYPAKKPVVPAQPGGQVADLETVRKNNARLMQVHAKVLKKLAQ